MYIVLRELMSLIGLNLIIAEIAIIKFLADRIKQQRILLDALLDKRVNHLLVRIISRLINAYSKEIS